MNLDILGFLKDNFKDFLYIIGAVVSFFVGKRLRKLNVQKEEVSVQAGELDNVEAALKIYRTMLNDLQARLKEAEAAADMIEKRYHKAVEEKEQLLEENKQLKQQLNEITSNS